MLLVLERIIDLSDQTSDKFSPSSSLELKSNAEYIHKEIDLVLESFQFQDRVSKILIQVENNLTNLISSVEKFQSQGSKRHKNLLHVEERVPVIQPNYKTVNQKPKRFNNVNEAGELTFFKRNQRAQKL